MNVVTIGFFIWALSKRRKIMNNMKEALKKAGYNVSTKDQEERTWWKHQSIGKLILHH